MNVALPVPLGSTLSRKRRHLARALSYGLRSVIFVPPYTSGTMRHKGKRAGERRYDGGFASGGYRIVILHWQRGWKGPPDT